MKKILFLPILASMLFVSCEGLLGNEENNNKTEVTKHEFTNVAVTAINLNQTTKSLGVGEESTLKATIAPRNASNKVITWSSTNPEVATVDSNGKVKAISVGKAEIVAKSNNGKEAKCSINVYRLELRIRSEEGEVAYTDFNIADFKNRQIEYKIHKEDGSVSAEWNLVNYDQHYSRAMLNSDKSKITFFFDIAEETKKYSGSLTLNNPTRTKEVSEVDATKFSTKKVVNEKTGEEEDVKDTSSYFIRGICIGKAYRSYDEVGGRAADPEVFVKDLNTNAVVGIRTGKNSLIGSFEKGDEIFSLVSETAITTESSVFGTIFYTSNASNTIKLSSYNNYQLDLSQATVLDTASKTAELFQTIEKRKNNLFKLFTIPAGNKYSNSKLSSGTPNPSLYFGIGYTSDGRDGYTDFAYYISTNNQPVIKVKNNNGTADQVFSFYYDQAASTYSLGDADTATRLLYPSRYVEGYTGPAVYVNGQDGCSVLNNNKDGMSSEKAMTFLYFGGDNYRMQPIGILDSSWIHD